MARKQGISTRLKLTLSYLVVLVVAEALLFAVVWAFLLRYVPTQAAVSPDGFFPGRADLIRAFAPAAFWAAIASLAFGALGGWVLAGRMLAPLDRITAATREASRGSLSHRIDMSDRNDEFGELADNFDGMLERLEAHVEAQRRFAANASHELRTPLSLTKALLEVADSDAELDAAQLHARLRQVNDRAISLTEAMLTLSRADAGGFAHETIDLGLAAEDAVETLFALAERSGIDVQFEIDSAGVLGSWSLMRQLVTNLLHNAIVHNLPSGGFVCVQVWTDGGEAVLRVENSGDSISDTLLVSMTEPFQRGTERVHATQAGAGLGLAIAQSIVRAHAGELHFEARDGGGLTATVRLPLAG